MSADLVARLRAALDETERVARAVPDRQDVFDGTGIIVAHYHGGVTRSVTVSSPVARFLARNDPAAVLRMVAAHRRILAAHPDARHPARSDPSSPYCPTCMENAPCPTVRALAKGYGITKETA